MVSGYLYDAIMHSLFIWGCDECVGAKLYCAPMAKRIADRAIQVLGGNGFVAEYKVTITITQIDHMNLFLFIECYT